MPRTSLAPIFDVEGPWDEREEITRVRCTNCGCMASGTDKEMAHILAQGYGLPVYKLFGCRCNCHHGRGRHPQLLKKREVR